MFTPPLPEAVRVQREQQLGEARAAAQAHPDDIEALVWLGRRTAYLGGYREAVAIYTRALERHPGEPRLLRHRGHRYLTLRRLDLAAADLERAAALVRGKSDEVEPDGLPNAHSVPTSTLQSNVWYHLGLARYLQGDFPAALAAYRECERASANADMRVATWHDARAVRAHPRVSTAPVTGVRLAAERKNSQVASTIAASRRMR